MRQPEAQGYHMTARVLFVRTARHARAPSQLMAKKVPLVSLNIDLQTTHREREPKNAGAHKALVPCDSAGPKVS